VLNEKKILYGVTGSIAAVKAPIIARELMRAGADVHCVLTPSAEQFTTGYALSVLTKNDVYSNIFTPTNSTWHVHLGRSVEAMLIAPCSATTLGKLRYGIYDNAVLLAASSLREGTPLILVPAMDEEMWLQPAVQENVVWLKAHGALVIQPTSGALASGLTGKGRMLETDELIAHVEELLSKGATRSAGWQPKNNSRLSGKKILITGGPTYEPIDPVRFIGNRSSGKMGAALADSALNDFGSHVTLIMGPSHEKTSPMVNRIDVETASEMLAATTSQFTGHDIIIMSAAVSDYRTKEYVDTKLKKGEKDIFHLELERTTDILKSLSLVKEPRQFLVGFALESRERGREYAKAKLASKSLDLIVLNYFDEEGAGFSTDTNHVAVFMKDGSEIEIPPMSKKACAKEILYIIEGSVS
jgi:phosphopantothenoylcysteine decarboxylase / phosphopantothenate---cysteine ligase